MMRSIYKIGIAVLVVAVGTTRIRAGRPAREGSLRNVPEHVLDAALEAATIVHGGAKACEIDVVRDKAEFEVIVMPSGEVVRILEEGQDPDDDEEEVTST